MIRLNQITANSVVGTLVYIALSLYAQAGVSSGAIDPKLSYTGRNLGEKHIKLAWVNLPRFIDACLWKEKSCKLTDAEAVLLKKIRVAFPQKYTMETLQFVSAKERPDLFNLEDSAHRIMVTGSSIGDVIYINSDQIYGGEGPSATPIKISTAIGLLVHELGHHQGLSDSVDRPLDVLGNKVSRHFDAHSFEINLAENQQGQIRFIVHNFTAGLADLPGRVPEGKNFLPRVWIADGEQLASYSEGVHYRAWCPYGDFVVEKVWIRNPHWVVSPPWIRSESNKKMMLKADAEYACTFRTGNQPEKVYTNSAYFFTFDLNTAPGSKNEWWDGGMATIGPYSHGRLDRVERIGPVTKIEISEFQMNTNKIHNGGDLKINAVLKSDTSESIWGCSVVFSSEQFTLYNPYGVEASGTTDKNPFGSPYTFRTNSDDCKVSKTIFGKFKVEATYSFPKSTPNRQYYIVSVNLYSKNRIEPFLGVPTLRQTVDVSSDQTPLPLEAVRFDLETRKGTTPSNIYKKAYLWGWEWDEKLKVKVLLKNGAHVIQSHLHSMIQYTGNYSEFFPKYLGDPYNLEEIHYKNIGDQLEITYILKISPDFDVLTPCESKDAEILRYTMLSTDLRELNLKLNPKDLGIVFGPFGAGCE